MKNLYFLLLITLYSIPTFAIAPLRYLEIADLVTCYEVGTEEKPFQVFHSNGNVENMLIAQAKFLNFTDSDFSKGGTFEFDGAVKDLGRRMWGAVTEECIQSVKNVSCGTSNIGTLEFIQEKNESYYLVKHKIGSSGNVVKMKFKQESCSYYPHGKPLLKSRVILFTVPIALYCANEGLMIFKISKYSEKHPFRIDYGVEDSDCVHTQLSSPTNYEYWMNARNDFDSEVVVNSASFAQEQKIDIDSDGDLDLIRMEKNYTNLFYPKGVYDFVLYLTP